MKARKHIMKSLVFKKQFTILKVGYTAGIYGCSNEYFNCIYTDNEGMHSIPFYGMYGAEQRLERVLNDKGYEYQYIHTDFGKMKSREVWKGFVSETEAIETVNKL